MSEQRPDLVASDGPPSDRAAPATAAPSDVTTFGSPDPAPFPMSASAPVTPPSLPSSWPEPQPSPARRSRVRAAIVGIGAVVVVLGGKILLGVVAGAVVTSTLGAVFGSPFQRLPTEQRTQLEARLTAAVGSSLDGLSDTDKQARIVTLLKAGLPRLSDTILIERVQLFTTALQGADPSSCAAVARGSFLARPDDAAAAKVIGGLETTSFGRWIEINVQAIEAQKSGTPAARTVASTASQAMYQALLGALPSTDIATITLVTSGGTAADADVCTAMRDLYNAGRTLGPTDLATFALIDVAS
jgi:hypothetical protein